MPTTLSLTKNRAALTAQRSDGMPIIGVVTLAVLFTVLVAIFMLQFDLGAAEPQIFVGP